MDGKTKIFIVEDESEIVKFVKKVLDAKGYLTATENNGKRAYERIVQERYDLILLDVMLPEMDGIEICKKVREISDVPIIMLTARSELDFKIQGLRSGAYDYVTKPFNMGELLARIEGTIAHAKNVPRPDSKRLIVGNVILYPERYEVTVKGEPVNLTPKEFDLLKYLMENKNIVKDRDKILQAVWGYDYVGSTNVVDVYIRYLRAHVEEEFDEKHIYTVRGVGYVIRD